MESGPLSPLTPSGRLEPSRDAARREQGSGGGRGRRRRKRDDQDPLSDSLRARLAEGTDDAPVTVAGHEEESRAPDEDPVRLAADDEAADGQKRGQRIDIRA